MPYVTDLPRALKRRGLTVEVVPGWEARGSASFNPYGAVCHWTAGPRTGDRPSLKVCIDGRPGLAGPLCNVFLTRAGVAVVVAAGRANHAGKGGWRGLVGNSSVFGTEAENSGGGEWTDAQRWAYPRINAAYVDLGAIPANICGHHEWAPNRKIDIRDYTMTRMRRDVAALLVGSKEDDDMPTADEVALAVWRYRNKNNKDSRDAYADLRNAGATAGNAHAATGLLAARLDAIENAISQLAGGATVIDMGKVRAAAEEAVRNVLREGVK